MSHGLAEKEKALCKFEIYDYFIDTDIFLQKEIYDGALEDVKSAMHRFHEVHTERRLICFL